MDSFAVTGTASRLVTGLEASAQVARASFFTQCARSTLQLAHANLQTATPESTASGVVHATARGAGSRRAAPAANRGGGRVVAESVSRLPRRNVQNPGTHLKVLTQTGGSGHVRPHLPSTLLPGPCSQWEPPAACTVTLSHPPAHVGRQLSSERATGPHVGVIAGGLYLQEAPPLLVITLSSLLTPGPCFRLPLSDSLSACALQGIHGDVEGGRAAPRRRRARVHQGRARGPVRPSLGALLRPYYPLFRIRAVDLFPLIIIVHAHVPSFAFAPLLF